MYNIECKLNVVSDASYFTISISNLFSQLSIQIVVDKQKTQSLLTTEALRKQITSQATTINIQKDRINIHNKKMLPPKNYLVISENEVCCCIYDPQN